MTVLEAVRRLIRNFAPEERTLPASSPTYQGRVEECLDALNDAFTEMVEMSPDFLRKDPRGTLLADPVTVSLALVRGSTTAVIAGASYADWMPGSTVFIPGASVDNEILEASDSDPNYNLTLRYPFDGTTGNHTATIFNDALTLGETELEVLEPVEIVGLRHLKVVAGPESLNTARSEEDYSLRNRRRTVTSLRRSDYTDSPAVCWLENHIPSSGTPLRRLRIFPLPRAAATLSYQARIAQPVYISADNTTIPLSARHASAILLPIAVYRLKASPFFRHGENDAAIDAAYETAVAMIPRTNPRPKGGPSFRPSA